MYNAAIYAQRNRPRVGDQIRGARSNDTFTVEQVDPRNGTVRVGRFDRDGKRVGTESVTFAQWQDQKAASARSSAINLAVDVANAPRSLFSSGDFSAPLRQGIILSAAEPQAAAKAFGVMFKSLKRARHEQLVESIAKRPNAAKYKEADLYLSTQVEEPHNATQREETFISNLAGKVPWVNASERSYVAYLDVLRSDAFDRFYRELESVPALKRDPKALAEEARNVARFINIATGRGEIPQSMRNYTPLMSALLFSPRYAASRLQFIGQTLTGYATMSPAARKIALRSSLRYVGALAAFLAFAKGAGASVSLNPDDADFLKARWGDWRYDLGGGNTQYLRFLWRFVAGMAKHAVGGESERGQTPADTAGKLLRSKLAPAPSLMVDWMTGKTFSGEAFDLPKGIGTRLLPGLAQDMWEAAHAEGLVGVAKMLPAGLGAGVSRYAEKRDTRRRPTRARRKRSSRDT